MTNILLNLAIPRKMERNAKLFLCFCVDKFGGNSDYLQIKELSQPEIRKFCREFEELLNMTFPREIERDYSSSLRPAYFGEAHNTENNYLKLYFEFSGEGLTTEKNQELGTFFLRKVDQLYTECISAWRIGNREHAAYEYYIKKYGIPGGARTPAYFEDNCPNTYSNQCSP